MYQTSLMGTTEIRNAELECRCTSRCWSDHTRRGQARKRSGDLHAVPAPDTPGLLPMNLDEPDGHGHYGRLDDDPERGLLCHECGRRFIHLGLHAWRGHGLTANEYRAAHGLSRVHGLVTAATLETIAGNARRNYPTNTTLIEARDRLVAKGMLMSQRNPMSPAGLAASRRRPGQGRLGTVVICDHCGAAFCPLASARRRRYCSRSCASRANRGARP